MVLIAVGFFFGGVRLRLRAIHLFSLCKISHIELMIRVLNGHPSIPFCTNASVSQDTILGDIVFLIFIHDLQDVIISRLDIYVVDTNIYFRLNNNPDTFDRIKLQLITKIVYILLRSG